MNFMYVPQRPSLEFLRGTTAAGVAPLFGSRALAPTRVRAACCEVRIDGSGRATMANAGHCQPYLDSHEIDLPNGLPLGLVEDAACEEFGVDMSHGQQLTLLSDGVVETRNHQGELYGFDRLNSSCNSGRPPNTSPTPP